MDGHSGRETSVANAASGQRLFWGDRASQPAGPLTHPRLWHAATHMSFSAVGRSYFRLRPAMTSRTSFSGRSPREDDAYGRRRAGDPGSRHDDRCRIEWAHHRRGHCRAPQPGPVWLGLFIGGAIGSAAFHSCLTFLSLAVLMMKRDSKLDQGGNAAQRHTPIPAQMIKGGPRCTIGCCTMRSSYF
jgi:hypothetical protein